MATIYNCPTDLIQPSFSEMDKYEEKANQFIKDLRDKLVKRNPKGKNVGEIIRFPVGDGQAEYMVANMKPVELVHIPLWDAWNFAYAHKLNAKDVNELIENQRRMAEIFSKKD